MACPTFDEAKQIVKINVVIKSPTRDEQTTNLVKSFYDVFIHKVKAVPRHLPCSERVRRIVGALTKFCEDCDVWVHEHWVLGVIDCVSCRVQAILRACLRACGNCYSECTIIMHPIKGFIIADPTWRSNRRAANRDRSPARAAGRARSRSRSRERRRSPRRRSPRRRSPARRNSPPLQDTGDRRLPLKKRLTAAAPAAPAAAAPAAPTTPPAAPAAPTTPPAAPAAPTPENIQSLLDEYSLRAQLQRGMYTRQPVDYSNLTYDNGAYQHGAYQYY